MDKGTRTAADAAAGGCCMRGISRKRYPLNVKSLCISLMFPRSSFQRESEHMPSFHPWISSRILDITGPGNGGGRSGNLRTSSFRNSLVDIWRWNGYPHDCTRVSNNDNARMAMCGFLLLASRATSIAPSRGLCTSIVRILRGYFT